MMKNTLKLALGLFALVLAPTAAQASDWTVTAKLTMVEATFMPDSFFVALDTDVGSCPSGTYMSYNRHGGDSESQIHNAEAAFAIALTAKSTGQSVRVVGNNSSGCNFDVIYLGSVDRR